MQIHPISAFSDNYIWLIINEKENTAFCVDPGEAEPVIAFIKKTGLTLKAALLTHHHYDHVGGIEELLKTYPTMDVYAPDDPRFPQTTHVLQGEESFVLDLMQFRVLTTPGHTATHISFYEPKRGWLFCGDTLFSAGCGRVFDGTFEELHHSLNKLKSLPDTTEIYCAHEYTKKNLRFASLVEPRNLIARNYLFELEKKRIPVHYPLQLD